MSRRSLIRSFKTSPEIIPLAVMVDVHVPLPLGQVGDLLHERAIDLRDETVQFWWPGRADSRRGEP